MGDDERVRNKHDRRCIGVLSLCTAESFISQVITVGAFAINTSSTAAYAAFTQESFNRNLLNSLVPENLELMVILELMGNLELRGNLKLREIPKLLSHSSLRACPMQYLGLERSFTFPSLFE